jgi:lysophospholipase
VGLPNAEYTFKSGTATLKLQYTPTEVDGMIDNGMHVATQGSDPQWSVCLGCAIVLKTGEPIADICKPCLAKYCYREHG